MKPFKKVKGTVSYFTALLFTLSTFSTFLSPLAHAEISKQKQIQSLVQSGISGKWGVIEKTFKGNSEIPLIYIQDAHSSFEAQENIAHLISQLVKSAGIKKVYTEGYQGEVPLDPLYPFEDREVKEKVSRYFLDYLRLSGAQYAFVNRTQDFQLIGIDETREYLANLEAYEAAAKSRVAISEDLKTISKDLKALGDRLYPKEIKEWLKLKERLRDQKISLADYIFRTMKFYVREAGSFDQKAYPHLGLFSKSLYQREMSKQEEELINRKIRQINSRDFFDELKRFEDDFVALLLTDPDAKEILKYQRGIELFSRLNLLSITPEEYAEIKSSYKDLRTQPLAEFLAKHLKKSLVIKKEWEGLVESALRFYEIAKKRDAIFQKNLILDVPSILVTGGFHKDAMTRFLEEKNISYILVSPRITQQDPDHQERYDFLMSGKFYQDETPFMQIVAATQAAQQPTQPLLEGLGANIVENNIQTALRLFPGKAVISEERAVAASLGGNIRQLAEAAFQSGKILASTRENVNKWSDPSYDVEIKGKRVHDQMVEWFETENYKALDDAFFKDVEPGTAGVRGMLGVGSNRINIITLGKFVEAHARHLQKIWNGEIAEKKLSHVRTKKAVILAYDSREGSYDPVTKGPGYLVKQAAEIYASYGFDVSVFDRPVPTPLLSFAVQQYGFLAGAVFTASHNPKTDNGYKPYDETGQQLLGADAAGLMNELRNPGKTSQVQKGNIEFVGDDFIKAYIKKVLEYGVHINPDGTYDLNYLDVEGVKAAFSPLHGTSGEIVPELLKARGFDIDNNLFVVEAQRKPDGTFPTAVKPNPEEPAALSMLRELAVKHDVDIAAANDPDADRIAVLVKTDRRGEYFTLNGNLQMAVVADYMLTQLKELKRLPEHSVLWKSLVSSDLMMEIGKKFGVPTIESRVGYKFSGDKMKEYIEKAMQSGYFTTYQLPQIKDVVGKVKEKGYSSLSRKERELFLSVLSRVLIFGGEESYGANRGDIVRDKDGPAMVDQFVEIAAFYKKRGTSIYERLFGKGGIFETYGYFKEDTGNYETPGAKGAQLKQAIMESFVKNPPREIAGKKVVAVLDFQNQMAKDIEGNMLFELNYQNSKTPGKFKLANGYEVHTFRDLDGKDIGKENFLEFILEDGSRIIPRPSGTEPKIKLYVLAKGRYENREAVDLWVESAKKALIQIAESVKARVEASSLGDETSDQQAIEWRETLDRGRNFYSGGMETTPITFKYKPVRKQDIQSIGDLSEAEKLRLIKIAVKSLIDGDGVISILAAGASSRMDPNEIKKLPKAYEMLRETLGDKNIKSKAAVPIGKVNGQIYTFIGAFLKNVERLQEQISGRLGNEINPLSLMIFSHEDYKDELLEELQRNHGYGTSEAQRLIFYQNSGYQFIARPKDLEVLKEKGKIKPEEFAKAMKVSEQALAEFKNGENPAATILPNEKAPLGHAEFLHQMVFSGTLLKLIQAGKKWISVRNIDNSAAAYDEKWLVTLGRFLSLDLDMQHEQSKRMSTQTGGGPIMEPGSDRQLLAEDPQLALPESKKNNVEPGTASDLINDAVAILSIDYVIDLYKKNPEQSHEDFIRELEEAAPYSVKAAEIARRGREKLPILIDPKPTKDPANKEKGIYAVKPETNLWTSTMAVSRDKKVQAVAVTGIGDYEQDYSKTEMAPEKAKEIAKRGRFLATKNWLGEKESYESNEKLFPAILDHILNDELIPQNLNLAEASSLGSLKGLNLVRVDKDMRNLKERPSLVVFSQQEWNNFGEAVQKEYITHFLEERIRIAMTHVEDGLSVPAVFRQKSKFFIALPDELNSESAGMLKEFRGEGKVIHLSQNLASPGEIASGLTDEQKAKVLFVKQNRDEEGVLSAALLFASGISIYKDSFKRDDSGFWVPTAVGKILMDLMRDYLGQRIVAQAA